MRQPDAVGRIARRWSAGGDTRAVFMRAQEDLTPDAFRTADPAPALAAPFVRVTSRKQLESLALEFQNCLADHAVRIADGRMAVYAWRVDPAAAIALNWDAAGWRLSEAKAPHNVDLEDGQLRELVRRLEAGSACAPDPPCRRSARGWMIGQTARLQPSDRRHVHRAAHPRRPVELTATRPQRHAPQRLNASCGACSFGANDALAHDVAPGARPDDIRTRSLGRTAQNVTPKKG
jgi:hypothetical protein